MNWHKLSNEQALEEVLMESRSRPVLFFKHSNRCSISSVARNRLESSWKIPEKNLKPYLVNVIDERPLSNEISQILHIRHESPQAIVVKNGSCIYHASHLGIDYEHIREIIEN